MSSLQRRSRPALVGLEGLLALAVAGCGYTSIAQAQGGAIVCPAHGWKFDLRTGRCLRGDERMRIAVYPVEVDGDSVYIDLA